MVTLHDAVSDVLADVNVSKEVELPWKDGTFNVTISVRLISLLYLNLNRKDVTASGRLSAAAVTPQKEE